ncbi:MAG: hypothetical protein R3261_04105, partial [Alphaproteobacteria bacterium]|nr:hypothetical protein [Alphaproteobacteria bacterium]
QAFIVEFSYSTGITLSVAEMIFDLSQVNTIAIACKAVGFNQSQFSDLLKKFLEEKYTNFADNSLIDKAVRYFARISDDKAEKYMDSWRESSATIRKTFK